MYVPFLLSPLQYLLTSSTYRVQHSIYWDTTYLGPKWFENHTTALEHLENGPGLLSSLIFAFLKDSTNFWRTRATRKHFFYQFFGHKTEPWSWWEFRVVQITVQTLYDAWTRWAITTKPKNQPQRHTHLFSIKGTDWIWHITFRSSQHPFTIFCHSHRQMEFTTPFCHFDPAIEKKSHQPPLCCWGEIR